jgi:hypothetical protein
MFSRDVHSAGGIRRQWAQMRQEEASSRLSVARDQMLTRIYEQAGELSITDDVAELAVRTAMPGALELAGRRAVGDVRMTDPPE